MKRRMGAQLVFMSCVSTGSPGEKSSDQVAGANRDGRAGSAKGTSARFYMGSPAGE